LHFNKLCGICIANLGLTAYDFYELTPIEFFEAIKNKRENEKALADIQYQTQWEVTRVTLFHLYNMNPHIKKPMKKIEQVFKLPWDSKKEMKEQTVEEMLSIFKKIQTVIKRNSKGMKPKKKKKGISKKEANRLQQEAWNTHKTNSKHL